MVQNQAQSRVGLVDIASASPPQNPTVGILWVDTSGVSKPVLRVFDGSSWLEVGGRSTDSDALALIVALS